MILGILQARTSSSRLPNKVLKELLGEPMLARQIERLQQSKLLDKLLVATSDQSEDGAIAELCERLNIPVSAVLLTMCCCVSIWRPNPTVRPMLCVSPVTAHWLILW